MATDFFTLAIIASVFVANSVSLSCDNLCDQINNGTCILNNTDEINSCCLNASDRTYTMKFNGSDLGLENLVLLVLDNLTLEDCTKPIIIENIPSVNITQSNFRLNIV